MAVAYGMRFGVQADFIQFDVAKWTVDQKKAIIKAMKTAARKWLEIIVQRTPRDSGFLLSAFDNLAAALGVSIKGDGLKKGLNAYARGQILDNLEHRYRNLRELAVTKKWLEHKTENRRILNARTGREQIKQVRTGVQRAIGKPLTRKELKQRSLDYKKKRDKLKRRGSDESKQAKKNIGNLLEEGLNVRTKSNVEAGEKKSIALFRREQAKKFYEEQRNRKSADRVLKRLSQIRKQIKGAKTKYQRAVDREPPLKQKERGKRYKWEKVEVSRDVTKQKLVDVPNPAYSARAVALAHKNKTTPPPKFIQRIESVTEKETKIIRRRIKAGSDKDWRKIYRKYYYPKNGQKGPIKNPETGRIFGTPTEKIFTLETEQGRAQSVSEETEPINKGGFEVPGKEIGNGGYTPTSALSNVSPVREVRMKLIFEYGVDIRYWKLMDTLGRWTRHGKPIKAKGAPWQAFIKANLAYQSILKKELESAILPFTAYCVKTTSKFAPGFKGGL